MCIRDSLADDGIRITTVLPGPTDTPGLGPWKERFAGKELGTPEAVADAIWDAYQNDQAPLELPIE